MGFQSQIRTLCVTLALCIACVMTAEQSRAGRLAVTGSDYETRRASARTPLTLAADGATSYRIVIRDEAGEVDSLAAERLAHYLDEITGAVFPVISASEFFGSEPAIFVGLSDPALDRLGGDPLGELGPQEHVARSVGEHVFLYGKGIHGSFHAAMEFLEVSLGWRWYTPFEAAALPHRPTVVLEPFERVRGFHMPYRASQLSKDLRFYYEQGINMGITRRADEIGATGLGYESEISDLLWYPHTLFGFIPPDADAPFVDRWTWIPRTDYFATNPEFFSLWETGDRVDDRQLCLSNADLRAELTQNVLLGIAEVGDRSLVAVSANDRPGKLCYCQHCQALMDLYQSPGGPLYDYLIELCGLLEQSKPYVRVSSLAYRREQTQIPPVLPAGQTLPTNLIIEFAPIEDCYFADWTHPDPAIQETYAHLQAWAEITEPGNLWAWLYPNPWGTGISMPVGNVDRLVTNMRLMHAAGVRGAFTDHSDYLARAGWSELQAYLYYRLCQEIDVDTEAVIAEVTADLYGPAAADMRLYLQELEAGRQAMAVLPPGVGYKSLEFDDLNFPYLTAANIHRWQGFFDRMEAALVGRPEREKINTRLARRELDLATLWKWFPLAEAYPDEYLDHTVHTARITAINETDGVGLPLGTSDMQFFSTVIAGGGEERDLPTEFDGIDPWRVRTFVPYRYRGEPRAVLDADAAWGYGIVVDSPNFPFTLGCHQMDTGTRVCTVSLGTDEIDAGSYQLVSLGELPITPETWVYFGRTWNTHFNLGRYLYDPDGVNRWRGYVSLKLDGPSYGGGAPQDIVVVDRVFMVSPCRPDLNGDGVVDTLDFLAFLGAWAGGEPAADWNRDDVIDTMDFLAFLNDWAAGC